MQIQQKDYYVQKDWQCLGYDIEDDVAQFKTDYLADFKLLDELPAFLTLISQKAQVVCENAYKSIWRSLIFYHY